MKNYKNAVAIAMVALMVFSIYSTVANANDQEKEYEGYLKAAREMAKLEVIEDAATNYRKALDMKDTVDVNIEIGQMYVDNGWLSEAISWGEGVVEKYPEEPAAYEFLLQQYISAQHYDKCFVLRDQAEGREAINAAFEELMAQIEYVFEMEYSTYDDVGVFGNGYCAVLDEEKWGYCDLYGDEEIKAKFLWAGAFTTDGVAPVQDENGNFYYISESGNKKIAIQNLEKCMDLGLSINQVLPAGDNGKYAYYNQKFEKVFDGEFTYATAMNGDVAAVETDGKWDLIGADGKMLTDSGYDGVILDEKGIVFRNDRVFVEKDNQVIMIDREGNRIGEQTYDDAQLFLQADGYAAVEVNGKWGFVDKAGKMMIEPQYEEARSFCNQFAAVKKDGSWGFIDAAGKPVIDFAFEGAKDFNERGCVFVKMNGKWKILKLMRMNYK